VIVPWEVDKDLLIWVEIEENTQFAQGSLAIFSPSDAMPRLILSDQRYSFEHPRWSRDGDWIAFRQRDVAKQPRYQMGIVRQDGTDLHVFPGEYGNMSNIGWSPNSDWLFFSAPVLDGGSPFAINTLTEEVVNLTPPSETKFDSVLRMRPSPTENIVAAAMRPKNQASAIELWLLSADSNLSEKIHLPSEMVQSCASDLTALDWSPSGESFLVQFEGLTLNDCSPELWLYQLDDKKWLNAAQPPDHLEPYSKEYFFVNWSPDGRWVAWQFNDNLLVYSTDDWEIVREIDLWRSSMMVMTFPWVLDGNNNSIITLEKSDLSYYPDYATILFGISPNGTESTNRRWTKIRPSYKWLPKDAIYHTMMWQP